GDGKSKDKNSWRSRRVRDLRFGAGNCQSARARTASGRGLPREHAYPRRSATRTGVRPRDGEVRPRVARWNAGRLDVEFARRAIVRSRLRPVFYSARPEKHAPALATLFLR